MAFRWMAHPEACHGIEEGQVRSDKNDQESGTKDPSNLVLFTFPPDPKSQEIAEAIESMKNSDQ
jgi:hypothetical protein